MLTRLYAPRTTTVFPTVVPHNILFDLLAEVPDDNRCLIKPVFDQSVKNMATMGLPPTFKSTLGTVYVWGRNRLPTPATGMIARMEDYKYNKCSYI